MCFSSCWRFGIYYSPLEFRGSPKGYNAADAEAIAAGFDYRSLGPKPYASDAEIAAKAHAQIKEIVEWYRPDILWFDAIDPRPRTGMDIAGFPARFGSMQSVQ
jgi:hypothetical protein